MSIAGARKQTNLWLVSVGESVVDPRAIEAIIPNFDHAPGCVLALSCGMTIVSTDKTPAQMVAWLARLALKPYPQPDQLGGSLCLWTCEHCKAEMRSGDTVRRLGRQGFLCNGCGERMAGGW